MTTTILICRHGETEWNKARKFQGSMDIPLNSEGREQARRIAEVMSGEGLSGVWTSPLSRAHDTAKRIADACHVDFWVDERLRERNLGILEGMPFREVAKGYPAVWKAWKKCEALPLEAGAEPDLLVKERLVSTFFDIAAEYPGGKVAVVSHAGLLRCLPALQAGGGVVGNGSITTVLVEPDGTWRVAGANDESHLSEPSLPERHPWEMQLRKDPDVIAALLAYDQGHQQASAVSRMARL